MNIYKLIRGFCKMTATPYRIMKRDYAKMNPKLRAEAKKKLKQFWEQSPELDHKKYYDLKKPLTKTQKGGAQ